MRKIILFLCLLLFYQHLISQNITRLEYFIDADPGYGNAVQVGISPDTLIEPEFVVDLTNIDIGFHILHIRAKDANGKWSLTYARPFLKEAIMMQEYAPDIVKMEYYIDDDPGYGCSVDVPVPADSTVAKDFIVDLTDVVNGFHILHVRTKDANGLWSLTYARPFLKENTCAADAAPDIVSIEWFFSADTVLPGEFSYTEFSHADSVAVDFSASIRHLNPDSSYFIHFFAKDANGGRSFEEVHEFGIEFYNTAPELIKPIADCTLDEDFDTLVVADLDTVFRDADLYAGDSLRYMMQIIGEGIAGKLQDSFMELYSVLNCFGESEVIISATDDSTEVISDTFMVTVLPVNDAPVCYELSNIALYEDHPDTIIGDLDLIFTDVDNDTLDYSWSVSDTNVIVTVDSLNVITLSLALNWSGIAQIIISGSDGEFILFDTIDVDVPAVNDGPTTPIIIAPGNGSEINSDGCLIWRFAEDIEGDLFRYHIQIDDSANFIDPEIEMNETDAKKSEILQREELKNLSLVTKGDSAYFVVLGKLPGFSNLVENAEYYWRVRAIDERGAVSFWQSSAHWFFLNQINEEPNAVISGFTPADSVSIGTLTPIIAWDAAIDPDPGDTPDKLCYVMQLSESAAFTDTLCEYVTPKGKNSVVADSLTDDRIFFYRVMSQDDKGLTSTWSLIQAFVTNTALDPPGDFALLSPKNGQDSVAAQVTFQWEKSKDRDFGDWAHYVLSYGADSNSVVQVDVGRDTVYILPEALGNGQYFWKVCAIDTDSLVTWASVCAERPFIFWIGAELGIDGKPAIPECFSLFQNYPNPFNPTTTIAYQLPKTSHVILSIYDISGRLVTTLVNEHKEAGYYSAVWNTVNVSSGLYLYVFEAEGFRSVRKCLLVK